MSRQLWPVLLTAIVWLTHLGVAVPESPTALCDRFMAEYPKLLESFEEPYKKSLSVSAIETVGDRKPVNRNAYFLADSFRLESASEKGTVVCCLNHNWAFTVMRKADQPYELGRLDDARTPLIDLEPELLLTKRLYRSHFCLHGEPLAQVISNPKFRILRSSIVRLDKSELLKIEFDRPVGGKTLRGSVTLDPNRDWLIHQFENETQSGKWLIYENTYTKDSIFPKKLRITLAGKIHDSLEFTSWSQDTLDPAPFSLAYYGIPEYSRKKSVWWWAVGTALIVALGAYWFKKKLTV